MYAREARELDALLFHFIGLFHEKFLTRFRLHDAGISGLKKNHVKVLSMLLQKETLMPSEIGRGLDIEKGSMTTLIDQLEGKGLVTRSSDPKDRRRLQIALSAAGKKVMNRIIDQHVRHVKDVLCDIDHWEIEQYLDCLRHAITFMKKL